MKSLVFAALFLAAVAAAKDCWKTEDCGEDECCVQRTFTILGRGKCKPMGQEGDTCNSEEITSWEGRYARHCPCTEPLKCIPEKEEKSIFGTIKINPTCKVETEVTTSEPEET